MQDPADEGADAGDPPADERVAATRQLAGVRQSFREGHRDAGADRGGEPADERVERLVADQRDREDRCERRQRAVDQADHRRLYTLQEEVMLVGHSNRVYQTDCKLVEHEEVLTTRMRGA